jgi:hypothetical protein
MKQVKNSSCGVSLAYAQQPGYDELPLFTG